MRISKVAKKSMAVAMAMAVAVGSVAVAPTKDASAAKAKSKKVNARVYFAGNAKGTDCLWIAGDGKTAKAVSKNVTLKKGKKTKVTLTIKKPAKYKVGSKSKKLRKYIRDLSRRTNLLARTTGDYLSTTSGVIRVTTLRQTMLKLLHSRRSLRSLSQLLLNN